MRNAFLVAHHIDRALQAIHAEFAAGLGEARAAVPEKAGCDQQQQCGKSEGGNSCDGFHWQSMRRKRRYGRLRAISRLHCARAQKRAQGKQPLRPSA